MTDGNAAANAGPSQVGAEGQLQAEPQQSGDEPSGRCWPPPRLVRSWLAVEACPQSLTTSAAISRICGIPDIATIAAACIPV
jgi:hypothetical protein